METKANYVAVGAFVLACVIGLVVTIMWLAGVQYAQEYSYYEADFKGPVTGLGSDVGHPFVGLGRALQEEGPGWLARRLHQAADGHGVRALRGQRQDAVARAADDERRSGAVEAGPLDGIQRRPAA